MGLKEAQNDFGRFMSISVTIEQLSNDFKKLDFRKFNKKYHTHFKKNENLRATERRIVGEFVKNKLPAGLELQKSYQTSKIKPKKIKQKSKKVKRKKYYKSQKYGKKRGNIKTKRKGIQNRWQYPYNVWDVKLQNFNKYWVKCKREIFKLKNAFVANPAIGFQQVGLEVLVEFVTKSNTYQDWIKFYSGISFSTQLIDLLDVAYKKFIKYLFEVYKKYPDSRVLRIKVIVIRNAH